MNMSDKYTKKLRIYYEKIELPTNSADFKLSKEDIKALKISNDKKKKVYLLKFGENYLLNIWRLRVIYPSKIAMDKIRSIRQEKDSFIIAIFL